MAQGGAGAQGPSAGGPGPQAGGGGPHGAGTPGPRSIYIYIYIYIYTTLISKRVPNPSFEYAVVPLISKRAPQCRNSFLSVLRSGAPHF